MVGMVWMIAASHVIAPEKAPSHFDEQAKCLIRENPRAASAFAAAIPGSDEERVAIAALHGDLERCGLTKTPPDGETLLLGEGIAAHIRLPQYPKIIKGSYRGLTNAQLDKNSASEGFLDAARSLPRPIAVVRCAVARNPRLNDDIITSKPGSTREGKLIALLAPDIGRCVDKGSSVQLSRPTIRAIIVRYQFARRLSLARPETLYWHQSKGGAAK